MQFKVISIDESQWKNEEDYDKMQGWCVGGYIAELAESLITGIVLKNHLFSFFAL